MEVIMSADYDMRMMLVRVPKEYDLVSNARARTQGV